MSEKVRIFRERAFRYFKIAELTLQNSFYDVSATSSHISAELFIKSAFLLLGKEPPYYAYHSVRKLISELGIYEPSFKEEISRITKEKRKELKALDECRSAGQYSEREVDKELAILCFNALQNVVIPLVEKIYKYKNSSA